MDAEQALTDLTEISSQIRAAVLLDEKGAVAASTLQGEQAARMGDAAKELLAAAERNRPGLGPGALSQFEVATLEGSVFVVRDHGCVIAATTAPEPTVGLVFYDLKTCLKSAREGKPEAPGAKPKKARKTAAPANEGEAPAEPEPTPGRKSKEDDAQS